MQTLHVDADTWMHRLPPRVKLAVLAVLGVVLFLTNNILLLGLAVIAGVFFYFTAGLSFSAALKRLRPVVLTILAVAVFSLFFNPAYAVGVTILRLISLVLFAAAITATTTITAFIDEITTLAMPLERAGLLKAADIGLAVGLVIRFVPDILDRYRAIREAHEARGLKLRTTTILVPLIILTLRDADIIAAAIDARGIRRD